MSRMGRWISRAWLSGGYFFLYLPIVVLIVFSFNSSRQDMIWTGFSLQWYAALAQDREIITAFGLSLRLALFTAIAALPAARCLVAWSVRRW
jgi:putrescine transport system permease protein